ncbi:hypothetical protein [Prosthecobacter sp.]|uniref:hypothetical protein n=1 Tax=Prosthecobacter sp. TaxID=1965333 RepID=UPI002489A7DA|nr:hypothetical protein [Prosthecobacter sp.]MDI1311804.1 hypothetical protein [Prosthecobacter sp.]
MPAPAYAAATSQFLVQWNQPPASTYSQVPDAFLTPAGYSIRINLSDLEVDKANCFSKSLGVDIGASAAYKKSSFKLTASALTALGGKYHPTTVNHLFLYGHSTWRTYAAGGANERGLSAQGRFLSAGAAAQYIDSLTQGQTSFLAVWLLTCYGGSDDLAPDDADASGDTSTFAKALSDKITSHSTLVMAFDKAVTKTTLDVCRQAALKYPKVMNMAEDFQTLKPQLSAEAQLLTFHKT